VGDGLGVHCDAAFFLSVPMHPAPILSRFSYGPKTFPARHAGHDGLNYIGKRGEVLAGAGLTSPGAPIRSPQIPKLRVGAFYKRHNQLMVSKPTDRP
jgi:hypothetical protein